MRKERKILRFVPQKLRKDLRMETLVYAKNTKKKLSEFNTFQERTFHILLTVSQKKRFKGCSFESELSLLELVVT